jgi:hypothetical protein
MRARWTDGVGVRGADGDAIGMKVRQLEDGFDIPREGKAVCMRMSGGRWVTFHGKWKSLARNKGMGSNLSLIEKCQLRSKTYLR